MKKAKWYFDFISPFAYLQLQQFPKLPTNIEITPIPAVFGAILKHWGQLGPAEIPPKRRFVYRFFQWNADQLGIPFDVISLRLFGGANDFDIPIEDEVTQKAGATVTHDLTRLLATCKKHYII